MMHISVHTVRGLWNALQCIANQSVPTHTSPDITSSWTNQLLACEIVLSFYTKTQLPIRLKIQGHNIDSYINHKCPRGWPDCGQPFSYLWMMIYYLNCSGCDSWRGMRKESCLCTGQRREFWGEMKILLNNIMNLVMISLTCIQQ